VPLLKERGRDVFGERGLQVRPGLLAQAGLESPPCAWRTAWRCCSPEIETSPFFFSRSFGSKIRLLGRAQWQMRVARALPATTWWVLTVVWSNAILAHMIRGLGRMRTALCPMCILILGACASSADSATSDVESYPSESEDEPLPSWGHTLPRAVENVWIFNHDSTWGEQALFGGVAEIDEGCLLVGGSVVIWDRSRTSLAAELVEGALAGESREVFLVGGHTESVPSEVATRCNADAVFLNSAESAR
jgi:hypothetical protein